MDKTVIYFKGTLKSSFSADEKDDNGNVIGISNNINLFLEGLTVDGSDKVSEFFAGIFKNTAKKYVPTWFKEDKDYCKFKSRYNIPVKIENEDKQMTFAQWVDRGEIRGASVTLKCNLVNGSVIYPSAMLVHEVGEVYDAFAEF
jgi:hypothetical protein